MSSNWDKLKDIAEERRAEAEKDQLERPHRCPHDGEQLFEQEDGTLYCRFDGVISVFELKL